jgi:16S rRNA (guanine1516-N2)-methyltransferase
VLGSMVTALAAEWPDFELCDEDDESGVWPRLVLRNQRLALCLEPGGSTWSPPVFDRRRISRQSLLARATGVVTNSNLVVLDAMAGWGSDGLELASLGASVTLVEAAPAVWSLLRQRITDSDIPIAGLHLADGWSLIEEAVWDVILLDPMFPERGRKGLAKLPMQTLKQVACEDDRPLAEWVEHALRHARSRVVLKRRRTEKLIGKPDWRIEGRSIRFDVYQRSGSSLRA